MRIKLRNVDHETDRAELEKLTNQIARTLTDYEEKQATEKELYTLLCDIQNSIAAWEYH